MASEYYCPIKLLGLAIGSLWFIT